MTTSSMTTSPKKDTYTVTRMSMRMLNIYASWTFIVSPNCLSWLSACFGRNDPEFESRRDRYFPKMLLHDLMNCECLLGRNDCAWRFFICYANLQLITPAVYLTARTMHVTRWYNSNRLWVLHVAGVLPDSKLIVAHYIMMQLKSILSCVAGISIIYEESPPPSSCDT